MLSERSNGPTKIEHFDHLRRVDRDD